MNRQRSLVRSRLLSPEFIPGLNENFLTNSIVFHLTDAHIGLVLFVWLVVLLFSETSCTTMHPPKAPFL